MNHGTSDMCSNRPQLCEGCNVDSCAKRNLVFDGNLLSPPGGAFLIGTLYMYSPVDN